jgi:hypothetical protein
VDIADELYEAYTDLFSCEAGDIEQFCFKGYTLVSFLSRYKLQSCPCVTPCVTAGFGKFLK